MKRLTNLKDSIMMPPPKARPKSRSDTSDELKRNLTENTNANEHSVMQEEFHKFFKEIEENENKKIEEENSLSMSKSTSSINLDKHLLYSLPMQNNYNTCVNKEQANKNSTANKNDFNYVNYDFISDDDDTDYKVSLEKLRKNLIKSEFKNKSFKAFKKLPKPVNKNQIKFFVSNLISYVNEYENDQIFQITKIKIQTRFNDYKNKALKQDYFVDNLMKMQTEIISRICMCSEGNKLIENFNFINNKRDRNISGNSNTIKNTNDLKSISNDSSNSSSSSVITSNSNISPNSSKIVKKVNNLFKLELNIN